MFKTIYQGFKLSLGMMFASFLIRSLGGLFRYIPHILGFSFGMGYSLLDLIQGIAADLIMTSQLVTSKVSLIFAYIEYGIRFVWAWAVYLVQYSHYCFSKASIETFGSQYVLHIVFASAVGVLIYLHISKKKSHQDEVDRYDRSLHHYFA